MSRKDFVFKTNLWLRLPQIRAFYVLAEAVSEIVLRSYFFEL